MTARTRLTITDRGAAVVLVVVVVGLIVADRLSAWVCA